MFANTASDLDAANAWRDDEPPASAAGEREVMATLICEIFARIIGCSAVGPDEDFFDAGGDSILAVTAALEIERATGQALSVTTIFEAPTARMIVAVLQSDAPPPGSRLVRLRPGREDAPIIFVHGLGGSVMELRDLARALETDQAVWGLQARGLDGIEAPLDRVEAMARLYVDALCDLQPVGAFRLIGFSFGGLVALEMASLLSQEGRRVALLAMLDSFPDARYWPLACRLDSWFRLLRLQASAGVWSRMWAHYSSVLRGMTLREVGAFLVSRPVVLEFGIFRVGALLQRFIGPGSAGANVATISEIPLPEVQRVKSAAETAMRLYRPRRYPGELVFVKALDAVRVTFDPRLLWRGLSGGLTIYGVAGDHLGIVSDQVGSLSKLLSDLVSETSTACQECTE